MIFNKEFWNKRYENKETGWDIGTASAPLKNYFDQIKDKKIKILIPGAGNAYEAEYLFNSGFENVFILDIAPIAVNNFKKRLPEFPIKNIIEGDFFEHKEKYDLIVEQTFFCAINPSLREQYKKQMHSLLKPKGKLVGLLFNDELNQDKPPFGGNSSEYRSLFSDLFHIKTLETAYNSIQPRASRELFIIFDKK